MENYSTTTKYDEIQQLRKNIRVNRNNMPTNHPININFITTTTTSNALNKNVHTSHHNSFLSHQTTYNNAPSSLDGTTTHCKSLKPTNLLQFLCVVSICIVCYWNTQQCNLVFDDISAIRDNKDLRPSTPWRNIFLNDFWGTPMRKEQSHKSYRPLTVLTFRLNYMLHDLEPFGYHIVNVVLHIVVCLLWQRVCRLILHHCAGLDSGVLNGGEPMRVRATASTITVAVQRNIQRKLNSCSFLAALLFAIHPIHTEAVTGVVGRAELLSSIFYLAAFLSYVNSVNCTVRTAPLKRLQHQQQQSTHWFSLTFTFGSCLLASMLCKEQGITIAGISAAYEVFVVQRLHPLDIWHYLLQFFEEQKIPLPHVVSKTDTPRGVTTSTTYSNRLIVLWSSMTLMKRLSFLIIITLALLVGRVYIMGSQLPIFTRFDNPASAADTPQRQLTFSYLIYVNAWLLLFPCDLCCDWTMGTIPLIEGFSDPRNIATAFTFAGLCALVIRACTTQHPEQARTLLMCLTWIGLPFLPASNLFFPVGFVVAERILYMPSMGFCLLVAYGYTQLQRHLEEKRTNAMKYIVRIMVLLLLLTHMIRTHQRNYDWYTEYTLFMSGLHVNARNAKLLNNVGHALENENRFDEALLYFQQAVIIQPDDIGAHINVGRTYNNLKMYEQAEEAYLKAKGLFPKIKPGESYEARIAPNHLNVFINLANLISKNHTRLEEADHLYRQAISMRSDYVQAYINRGDILMKLNRTAKAQEVYEKALLYDNQNADIYYNLGVVFLEQGKSTQAHIYFNKAIELYPEHEQALINSAILLQEIGGTDARHLSRERLYKVLTKDEHNEKVYFNLGMLAMDETKFDEAEAFFKRAIHLKDNFRSALFNLALLLADTNRPLDAVPYLNQLIRYHPDHIKGLILLGDIYINHMKDLDAAESCYRIILKYDPRNIQGLHNLCVVFVERKWLAKAGACLRYAHHLAPSEDYIIRHLEIVQMRLKKLNTLADTSIEKRIAFTEYDPYEFLIVPS